MPARYWAVGLTGGWAFHPTERLDVRIGVGGQNFSWHVPYGGFRTDYNSPYLETQLLVGYRL